MAKGLSWVAIFLAVMMVVLFWLTSYEEPGSQSPMFDLSFYAGLLAPIVAVAGLLLAKRGGKRAPRLARVALAFGIGACSWPLLVIIVFTGGY
jgi:hypothetical protein